MSQDWFDLWMEYDDCPSLCHILILGGKDGIIPILATWTEMGEVWLIKGKETSKKARKHWLCEHSNIFVPEAKVPLIPW